MSVSGPVTIAELRELFEQKETGIVAKIAEADGMYQGNEAHYFHVGQSALQSIKLAMLAAGKSSVGRLLDLPCGYGRVLRVLKAAFPQAELTACDILTDGVDFCAAEFGARPVYAQAEPGAIALDGEFDLIWCGSLLTHLAQTNWLGFLRLFDEHLAAGGLGVVTTHGRWVVERMRRGEENYGLEPDQLQRLLADYEQAGFGFGHYFHSPDYGISASSPAWVCARLADFPRLRLLTFHERGWDDHQDVVAFARVA
ncbi:MAG: class I SAM-dependent methyltransferase [Acidobacteriota bacterium]|nr:class I SAM-dependent methyltransferase [Acidobacteriota bacterium]